MADDDVELFPMREERIERNRHRKQEPLDVDVEEELFGDFTVHAPPEEHRRSMLMMSQRGLEQRVSTGTQFFDQHTPAQGEQYNTSSRGATSAAHRRIGVSNTMPNVPFADAPWTLDGWGLPSEVVQVYASQGIVRLYPWQRGCLFEHFEGTLPRPKSMLVDPAKASTQSRKELPNLLYSAPTSGGKTLVAELLLLLRVIHDGKKGMFVVPYVALAEEKANALSRVAAAVGKSVKCHAGGKGQRSLGSDILVCTTEKANILLNTFIEQNRVSELGVVVVDELHQIGDDGRGYVLELFLTKIVSLSATLCEGLQIVSMSATLSNASQIAKWMCNSKLFITDYRPVPLTEHYVIGNNVYSSNGAIVRQLQNSSEKDRNVVELICEGLSGGFLVLVFCPSRKGCEVTAQQVARCVTENKLSVHERFSNAESRRNLVSKRLKEATGGTPDEILAVSVPVGVGFHHAAMTSEEKSIIAESFKAETLWVLCCTTTLATGVNLPARRVIFKAPRIAFAPLDPSRYRQAAGRAGRAGLDDRGESFVVGKPGERALLATLVSSTLPPVHSNFGSERRGMMRVLLEGVTSGRVRNVQDIEKCIKGTLLYSTVEADVAMQTGLEATNFLAELHFIVWNDHKEEYSATQLGDATVASGMAPDEALTIFSELERSKQHLNLSEDTQLVFHCTPLYSGIEPHWDALYSYFSSLPAPVQQSLSAIGIDEGFLVQAVSAPPPRSSKTAAAVMHRRLFASFILCEAVKEVPLSSIGARFGIVRGEVQRLMETASTFASMVSTFCDRLSWWFFPPLIDKMSSRLNRGVEPELLPLIRIPGLATWRARELYKKGFRTLLSLAAARDDELERSLSVKTPFRVDAAEDVWEGRDARSLVRLIKQGAAAALREEANELTETIEEIASGLKTSSPQRFPSLSPLRLAETAHSAAPVGRGALCWRKVNCTSFEEWQRAREEILASPLVAVMVVPRSATDLLLVVALETSGNVLCVSSPKRKHDADEFGEHIAFLRDVLLPATTIMKAIFSWQDVLRLLARYHVLEASTMFAIANNVVDPVVVDWIVAPDDRPSWKVPKVDELARTHGSEIVEVLPEDAHSSTAQEAALCKMTLGATRALLHKARTNGVLQPLVNVEMPLVACVVQMELRGIGFDRREYEQKLHLMREKVRCLTVEAYSVAGRSDWQLSSPKDCARILFDVLEMPCLERTFDAQSLRKRSKRKRAERESRSTRGSVLRSLEKLFPDNPMPSIIREFRTLAGWIDKYILSLLGCDVKGRIYGRFLHCATSTGRLSMMDPNLQTIPHPIEFNLDGKPIGLRLRKAFVASEGHLLLSADYCQIEARLLAHFSGDVELLKCFQEGVDVFKRLASVLHKKNVADVSAEERRAAKTLCYGIIYGKGKGSIAEDLEISESDAEELLCAFRATYAGASTFANSVIAQSAKCGFVETLTGRRRWLPFASSSIPKLKAASDRQAVNTICQGSAADIIKLAMIRLSRDPLFCGDSPVAAIVLQIHDELLIEVKSDCVRDAVVATRKAMESPAVTQQLNVLLPVTVCVGSNWAEMESAAC